MKQLIIPFAPLSSEASDIENVLAGIRGLLRAAGYEYTIGVQANNGWHPVSEKPTEDGEYIVIFGLNFKFTCRYTADAGWRDIYEPRWWQPFPELPESEASS